MTEHLTTAWLDEAREILAAQEKEPPSPLAGMSAIEVFELFNGSCAFAQKPTLSFADLAFVESCEKRLRVRLSQAVEHCRQEQCYD
jgi:hypothetical protein